MSTITASVAVQNQQTHVPKGSPGHLQGPNQVGLYDPPCPGEFVALSRLQLAGIAIQGDLRQEAETTDKRCEKPYGVPECLPNGSPRARFGAACPGRCDIAGIAMRRPCTKVRKLYGDRQT